MEKNNSIKMYIFLGIIGVIIVAGFIFMQKSMKTDNKPKKEKNETIDIRLDDTKEYIYFENGERIEDELDIEYKKIVINFDETTDLEKVLNEETNELKQSVTYDKTNEDAQYNGLVSAKYKTYKVYAFDKYISLVVDYYQFTVDDLVSYLDTKTYVFDKSTGQIISDDDLLKEYNLTQIDVINKIKEYVTGQDLVDQSQVLDADATVGQITDLALYVDKVGRLSVSILVKSDQKDYNDIVILN